MDRLQEIYNTMDGKVFDLFMEDVLATYKFLDRAGCYAEDLPEWMRTTIALKIVTDRVRLTNPVLKKAYQNAKQF